MFQYQYETPQGRLPGQPVLEEEMDPSRRVAVPNICDDHHVKARGIAKVSRSIYLAKKKEIWDFLHRGKTLLEFRPPVKSIGPEENGTSQNHTDDKEHQ